MDPTLVSWRSVVVDPLHGVFSKILIRNLLPKLIGGTDLESGFD